MGLGIAEVLARRAKVRGETSLFAGLGVLHATSCIAICYILRAWRRASSLGHGWCSSGIFIRMPRER